MARIINNAPTSLWLEKPLEGGPEVAIRRTPRKNQPGVALTMNRANMRDQVSRVVTAIRLKESPMSISLGLV